MLQLLVKVFTKDEDIIKVYSNTLVQQVLEHQVHQVLEGGRSIGKVLWHNNIFKQTHWCQKSHFVLVAFFYAHLVVRRGHVNGTEYSGLTKLVKKVVYTWYWKHVQTNLLIQATKTDAHVEFTSLFAYKEDGCTVW